MEEFNSQLEAKEGTTGHNEKKQLEILNRILGIIKEKVGEKEGLKVNIGVSLVDDCENSDLVNMIAKLVDAEVDTKRMSKEDGKDVLGRIIKELPEYVGLFGKNMEEYSGIEDRYQYLIDTNESEQLEQEEN